MPHSLVYTTCAANKSTSKCTILFYIDEECVFDAHIICPFNAYTCRAENEHTCVYVMRKHSSTFHCWTLFWFVWKNEKYLQFILHNADHGAKDIRLRFEMLLLLHLWLKVIHTDMYRKKNPAKCGHKKIVYCIKFVIDRVRDDFFSTF